MQRRPVHSFFALALWAAYPLILYAGLLWGEPRWVGLLLLAHLVLRHRNGALKLASGFGWTDRAVLLCLLLHSALAALTNSEIMVRLFPVAMNLGVLSLFVRSLAAPQSMVERLARLREPHLSPQGVAYTRRVTQVWCVFLIANAAAALWTALYASQAQWAFYNGLIAYLLMGVLFSGEWLFRSYWRKRVL